MAKARPESVPAPMPNADPPPVAVRIRPVRPVFSGYPPLDGDTERRLASGRARPAARIDLHGMTEAAAHAALAGFITRCVREQKRIVLVITGKGPQGQGVLKQNLSGWLEAPAMRGLVVGFRPALQRDGGEGATYVMLRRKRNQ